MNIKNQRKIAIVIIIISILILAFAFILILIDVSKNNQNNNVEIYNESNIYFVIKSQDKYGIAKVDGTIIIKPNFDKIARVDNTVYLKNDDESFFYSLTNGTYKNLDGKESDVYFAYSEDGTLLPYFIFKYGSDDAIYMIYNTDGTKYVESDYTNLNDVYEKINAKKQFTSKNFSINLITNYTLIKELPYLTKDFKNQYIVTKIGDNTKKGIIDETGKIILDFKYSDIEVVKNKEIAVKVKDSNGEYIFTRQEKLGKIDDNFDIVAVDSNCYLQLRGTTVNKIYDSNLNLINSGIYTYPGDFIFANTLKLKSYLILKKNDKEYVLYDISNQGKEVGDYSNVINDYFKNYKNDYRLSTILYKDGTTMYAIDLESLKTLKVLVSNDYISSPLDYGNIYM